MSGMNGKIKKWKFLTAAVAMAVGFWATPQGAGAATSVSGVGTTSTFNLNGATAGTSATAVGDSAKAGNYSTAIGDSVQSTADSVAIGYKANADGNSMAIGNSASAINGSVSIGYKTGASAASSIAIGYATTASGVLGIAIGGSAGSGAAANVTGHSGIAVGASSSASGDLSIAMGREASTTDSYGIAIGSSASAAYLGLAIGAKASASSHSIVIGSNLRMDNVSDNGNDYAVIIGSDYGVTGKDSYGIVVIGSAWENSGSLAVSIGRSASVSGEEAVALGSGKAFGSYSTAITNGHAYTDRSIAIGYAANVGTEGTKESGGVAGIAIGGGGNQSGGASVSADRGIAIGSVTVASGKDSIAMGTGSSAEAEGSLALGYSTNASGVYSTALGGANAYDRYSFAAGYCAAVGTSGATTSAGLGGIAIGSATKEDGWTAGAMALGDYGIALGTSSSVSAEKSLALGYGASATAANAVALGQGSVADTANTISVGSSSSTRKIVNVTAGSATTDAANYGQLVKKQNYTVSGGTLTVYNNQYTGGDATEDQIAFTVSGIGSGGSSIVDYDTNYAISNDHWLSTDFGGTYTKGANSAAYGYGANASGESSTALGYNAKASEVNSVALGSGSSAWADYSVSLGGATVGEAGGSTGVYGIAVGHESSVTADNSVALGYGASATAANAVALGQGAVADTANTISVGSGTNTRKIVNVTAGSNATDAANYGQIVTGGSYNSTTGTLTFTNGAGTTAFTIDGFTGGGGGSGTTYTAGNGIDIDTTGETPTISANVAEKGGLSVDKDGLSVKVAENGGLSTDTNGLAVKVAEKGALSVNESGLSVKVAENGGLTVDDNGLAVQKDGQVAKDNTGIVTGGTVYNSMVTNGSYDSSTGKLTFTNGKGDTSFSVAINGSGVIYKGDDKTVTLSDNNEFSVKYDTTDFTVNDSGLAVKKDGKVESGNTGLVTGGTVYDAMKSMDNQVSQLSDDIQKVGAGAAALAALRPEAYDPNDKWSFAVGYGHYKGTNAGALGAFFKPNEDTTVSLASTVGNGDPMVNMGLSFKLGNKGKQAGTYRSAVDLVQRIDALEAVVVKEAKRNDIQDSRLNAQERKIAQLQADIARMQQQIANLLSDSGMAIH